MKKLLFILPLFFVGLSILHVQTIQSEKTFGGTKFTQKGNVLSMRDMVYIMEPYPEAHSLMKKARSNNAVATIFGVIGGGLVGWTIGGALAGGEPSWVPAGVGIVALGIGIPISITANKKAKQAVDIYNSKVSPIPERGNEVGLKISMNGQCVRLAITF